MASRRTCSSFSRETRPFFLNKSLGKQQLSCKDLPVAPQRSVCYLLPPGSVFWTWSEQVYSPFFSSWFLACVTYNLGAHATGLLIQHSCLSSPCYLSQHVHNGHLTLFFFFFVKGKGKKTWWLKSRSVKMVLQL